MPAALMTADADFENIENADGHNAMTLVNKDDRRHSLALSLPLWLANPSGRYTNQWDLNRH